MRIVMGSEIAQIDAMAMSAFGIHGLQLRENAGRAVAAQAIALLDGLGPEAKKDIAIFAGGGNNGGDGLVAARHLHNQGYTVRLFLLSEPEQWKEDAYVNWEICQKLEIPFTMVDDISQRKLLRISLLNCGLIIDGIFGTGFHGAPNALAAEVIQAVNQSKKAVLSIDIPSGVNATTGEVAGAAIRATETVTFGWAKWGLCVLPGKDYTGRLQIADITLPKALLEKIDSNIEWLDSQFIRAALPQRQKDSHKGTYGHTLVVGGSGNMFGAPILAVGGALKTGSGLVTLASAEGIPAPLAAGFPEAMTLPFKTENGRLTQQAFPPIANAMKDKAVVLGMGMGRSRQTQELIHKLFQTPCKGMVVDADALFALAKNPCRFDGKDYPVILTPHPKEMADLLGVSTAEVQSNRLQAATQCAKQYGAIVVLKGADTLVVANQKAMQPQVYLNPTGNPGMATGGSGDVLAGVIGSLLAQGLAGNTAAAAGVYLHGKAGDFAKDHLGEYGMSARDIITYLPQAIQAATK